MKELTEGTIYSHVQSAGNVSLRKEI
ncbi:unnamed protein product [Staurois parvus]|uniref:Uncharacterized protein n=1 Tax=Staurois parvus TaxID=386267 RepID=A0ABN9AG57_9NEOB|nr:unnamed protein product [Staurois parvus]